MNNNKGFTLIEVILVIAIIAILSITLIPNVMKLVKENDTNSFCNLIDTIKSSASLYITQNRYNPDIIKEIKKCKSEAIDELAITKTIKELIDEGYLKLNEDPLKDPMNKSNVDIETEVIITYNCSQQDFTDISIDSDSNLVDNYDTYCKNN